MTMILSDLRGVPHTSISQLKTFLQCPRKFRFIYVDRIEPEFRPIALAFGTAWHETIGAHLLPPVKDQWRSREQLQTMFRDSPTEQVNEDGPPVLFDDEEDLGKCVDLRLRGLGGSCQASWCAACSKSYPEAHCLRSPHAAGQRRRGVLIEWAFILGAPGRRDEGIERTGVRRSRPPDRWSAVSSRLPGPRRCAGRRAASGS